MEMRRHPFLVELDQRYLAGPVPDEAGWYAAVRAELDPAYLAAETPYGQSGVSGDAAPPASGYPERNRWPICRALHRDGDLLLDIGCANGLLMETLVRWAAADGDGPDDPRRAIATVRVAWVDRR